MSEAAVYVILMIAALLLLAAATLLYYVRLHARLRAKGHRSPLYALALGIPAFAGFLGGLILFLTSDRLAQSNSQSFDAGLIGESFGRFLIYAVGISGASALLAGVVVWKLPAGAVRSFGARRVIFPWKRVAQFLIAVGVALVLAEWVLGFDEIQSLRISAQVLMPATVYCLYLARRASAADLQKVISTDARPPVLYLRAFNREGEMFADVRMKDVWKYTRDVLNRSAVTFEQYFSPSINQRIGPFVALGSPEDYLPPEGAARAYAHDDGWMREFSNLAASARCILMEVDDSANLRWELESLRHAGLHRKLYVLTRPRELRGLKNVRMMLGRKFYRLRARLKGLQPVSWSAFVAAMRPLGYTFPEIDPGPGAVICIDVANNARVLTQDAKSPEEYLDPIIERAIAPTATAS